MLSQNWKVGMHESGTFKFFGWGVRQTKDRITIDQNLYVSSISPKDIKKGSSLRKIDELSQEEKKELKRPTGEMMWIST